MTPEPSAGIVITRRLLWAAASALGVIAGSVGTWVTAGPFSVSGTTQGDGTVTLVLGVVALGLVVAEKARPGVAVVAAAALAVGAIDASSVLRASGDGELLSIGLGWGLIVLVLSAASLLAWAATELLRGGARTRTVVGVGTLLALVVTAAIMGASGRFDVESESDAPEAAATTESVPAAPADSASEAVDEPEPEPEPEPPTPQVADVGDPIVLTGADDLTVRATVTKVLDPLPLGEYELPTAGKRMVGVELRLTNQSTTTVYDDSPSNGAALIYGADKEADATILSGDCSGSSVKVRPGDSRKVCIPFEVSARSALKRFQLALDSGFADDSGEWTLPAHGTAATRAADAEAVDVPEPDAEDASDEVAPDTTACDQNISAGPGTTCGFADDVFREYAEALQSGDEGSSVTVRATSPANGRTYTVTCDVADDDVQCSAGDGAYVAFPQWAASVY